jgi:hypothetical protein
VISFHTPSWGGGAGRVAAAPSQYISFINLQGAACQRTLHKDGWTVRAYCTSKWVGLVLVVNISQYIPGSFLISKMHNNDPTAYPSIDGLVSVVKRGGGMEGSVIQVFRFSGFQVFWFSGFLVSCRFWSILPCPLYHHTCYLLVLHSYLHLHCTCTCTVLALALHLHLHCTCIKYRSDQINLGKI